MKNIPATVKLAGRTVPCTVRRSKRARNLRLQVSLENGLEVIVPQRFDLSGLEKVLQEKESWILAKLDHFASFAEERCRGRENTDPPVLYRGREYRVEIVANGGTAPRVLVEEDRLVVFLPPGSEAKAGAVLEKWFRSMARLLVNQRLRVINADLKLTFNRVFIKGQKTRWGSCSRQGNLNFNWRLVMAPLPVLDYVVAHELLHLLEPNHSKRFWTLVERVCPDYKAHRAWLRKNGHRLTLPAFDFAGYLPEGSGNGLMGQHGPPGCHQQDHKAAQAHRQH